jgi:DinB superfamily
MTSPTDRTGIEPDEKDWTWVLQKPCPDCGFDARTVAGQQVATRLRSNATRWSAVLGRADVKARPQPRVWSPLEYGCHVRDVCRVFELRVNLMRLQGDPAFENWDQDAAAVADAYGAQDPAVVSVELSAAAGAAATAFEAVGAGEWQRTGRRSNGAVFTIETLGQYFLHDVTHHLHDVRG